jgi:hypothetical protein
MPLFNQHLHVIERAIGLAAAEMIQRVSDGVSVLFRSSGVGHQFCGASRVAITASQPREQA